MNNKLIATLLLGAASLYLGGCATGPQRPVEPLQTVSTGVPAETVQAMLIDYYQSENSVFEPVDITPHGIEFKADCVAAGLNPFQCSVMMLAVGNSGWSGPYLHAQWTTLNLQGETKVSLSGKYCAVNAMGRENCAEFDPQVNADLNKRLRHFEATRLVSAEG